jgi:hypothetical protein
MVPEYAGILCDPGDGDGLRRALAEALRRTWDADRIRGHAAQHTWDEAAARLARQWRAAVPPRAGSMNWEKG